MLQVIETVLAVLVNLLQRETTMRIKASKRAADQSYAAATRMKSESEKAGKAANLASKIEGLLK